MRKKEHISNCEIAKKIIPFYNSYNYAGLRTKGNRYAYDDFCVSDDEFDEEEEIDNENNQEFENEIKDEEILINDESVQEHDSENISNNIIKENNDNDIYSIISSNNEKQSKKKKKRKNVILESSYESDENEIDEKQNKTTYNNDDILSDNDCLENLSSSPVLPSIETCMEDLFCNTPIKEKKLTKKINNGKGKNAIIMNNNKSIHDNMTENDDNLLTNNKCTKDPLNLFSDELNDSVDMLIHDTSNKYEKSENEKNFIKDNDFTIQEDLLGINSSLSSITHNKNNLEGNYNNKDKDPLNLFSNDIGSTSNKPFKSSLNIEKNSNKNIKNKLK